MKSRRSGNRSSAFEFWPPVSHRTDQRPVLTSFQSVGSEAPCGAMTATRPWYETATLETEQERKVDALQGAVADLLAVRSLRRRRCGDHPFPRFVPP